MFKVRLLRFVESLIFFLSVIIALLTFVAFVLSILAGFICIELLTAQATIFTASTGSAFFLHNLKLKRIDRAHKLYEEFENADYRQARKLLRALREPYEKGEITPVHLEKLIYNDRIDTQVKKLKEICGFSDEEQEKLLESLIFTFNFWEKVYIEIVRGYSDEWYLREQLFGVFIIQYERFHFWLKKYIKSNVPLQYSHFKDFYVYAKRVTNNSNLTLSQKIRKWWCAV